MLDGFIISVHYRDHLGPTTSYSATIPPDYGAGNYARNVIENATPRRLEKREIARAPAPLDALVDEATEAVPVREPEPPFPAPLPAGFEPLVGVASEAKSV
jgi:hypothetical protein